MHFTIHHDRNIDEKIQSDLEQIKATLVTRFGRRVSALILVGGFGRGEGSVILRQKQITPINDYDVIVVSRWPFFSGKKLKQISLELTKKLNIRFVDLTFKFYYFLPFSPCTMYNYDARYGSYVFFGDAKIPEHLPSYKKGFLPTMEGEALFFNRLIAPFELLTKDILIHDSKDIKVLLQIGKSIIAAMDFTLIQEGKYHHQYRERLSLFRKMKVNEEFKRLCDFAVSLKLKPSDNHLPFSIKELLKRAIEFNLHVLSRFYNCEKSQEAIIVAHRKSKRLKSKSTAFIQLEHRVLCFYFRDFNIVEKDQVDDFIQQKQNLLSTWLNIHH